MVISVIVVTAVIVRIVRTAEIVTMTVIVGLSFSVLQLYCLAPPSGCKLPSGLFGVDIGVCIRFTQFTATTTFSGYTGWIGPF